MNTITTHILDTSKGNPAEGITITLYRQEENAWKEISRSKTDASGRAGNFTNQHLQGVYKLRFETKKYFESSQTPTFYPYVEIVFEVSANEHYHVPLLLNPYGYATYRGS